MARQRVTLNRGQRGELERFSTTGARPAKALLRARALLLLDHGEDGPRWTLRNVSTAAGLSTRALKSLKARFLAEGMRAAVARRPRPPRETRANNNAAAARLEAMARSQPPGGRARWTLRMLRDALAAEHAAPRVSPPTIAKWLRRAGVDWGAEWTAKPKHAKTLGNTPEKKIKKNAFQC